MIWGILGFLITIGVLVTIHEWGHFAVARFFGVKILRFSLGFGKPILSWTGKKDGADSSRRIRANVRRKRWRRDSRRR